jgi:hypothetical protein
VASALADCSGARGVVAERLTQRGSVVVAEVEAVPADLGSRPATARAMLEVEHRHRPDVPLALGPGVEVDVLELEHHVDLAARGIGVEPRLLDRGRGRLADVEQPGRRPANTSRCISCDELVDAGAVDTNGGVAVASCRRPRPSGSRQPSDPRRGSVPASSSSTFESMLMTSIRKPSTPRSSQRFIIA